MSAQSTTHQTHGEPRLYEGDGDALMSAARPSDHITLLPEPAQTLDKAGRIRILWGQQMLPDLLAGRYRSVICGVNDDDNSHGIIAQLVELAKTSQWTPDSVTSYAKMFSESVSIHAAGDREPYVLKYDLDSMLILGILRPKRKKHFTLDDLSRGFQTIQRMLDGRRERQPVASVSFLGARSNRLVVSDQDESEPSMETVLKTMYAAGSRWGVYPSYPFPEGLDRMRAGSS